MSRHRRQSLRRRRLQAARALARLEALCPPHLSLDEWMHQRREFDRVMGIAKQSRFFRALHGLI